MTARRQVLVSLVAAAAVAVTVVPAHAASRRSAPWAGGPAALTQPGEPRSALTQGEALGGWPRRDVPSVDVALPQTVAVTRSSHTLYVTTDSGVVSVIDADRCNAHRDSGCGAPVATMTFDAKGGGDVAISERMGTGYVTNPDKGTVSVFDATRCNARRTSGCRDAHPAVTVGGTPIGLDINERPRPVYVGSAGTFVSVIDGRRCNRRRTAGCAAAPARVVTKPGPLWPTVDPATNTVYVPENGEENVFPPGNTLAVIDGARCSARVVSGCGDAPARATVGGGPAVAAVDPRTRTVYVENAADL